MFCGCDAWMAAWVFCGRDAWMAVLPFVLSAVIEFSCLLALLEGKFIVPSSIWSAEGFLLWGARDIKSLCFCFRRGSWVVEAILE